MCKSYMNSRLCSAKQQCDEHMQKPWCGPLMVLCCNLRHIQSSMSHCCHHFLALAVLRSAVALERLFLGFYTTCCIKAFAQITCLGPVLVFVPHCIVLLSIASRGCSSLNLKQLHSRLNRISFSNLLLLLMP